MRLGVTGTRGEAAMDIPEGPPYLKVWGVGKLGCVFLGTYGGYEVWFDAWLKFCEALELAKELGFCTKEVHGEAALYKPVPTIEMSLGGKTWTIIKDWSFYGGAEEAHACEWWWTEGNGSCDCNRSLSIQDVDPEFPEMPCGDTIQAKVTVKLVHRDELQPAG